MFLRSSSFLILTEGNLLLTADTLFAGFVVDGVTIEVQTAEAVGVVKRQPRVTLWVTHSLIDLCFMIG